MPQGTNVGSVWFNITSNKSAFTKEMQSAAKSTESVFASSMKKVGGFIASAFAVKKVVDFGKKCVEVASETQSAWTGLSSILSGQGQSFNQANKFIQSYIKDGLVPLNNAVTAYKNLSARGYSTEQIEKVMTSLKDAAAFGRQASYSYGEAIQSATEGLKNENSTLVDNAGVTKNVAKMWEDYAKSIGTTTNNLTQAQKIQAEVNGIIEESKWQTGDAAKYADTYAGRTARLSASMTTLKTSIGNVIIPIANMFIPAVQSAIDVTQRFTDILSSTLSVLGVEMFDTSQFANVAGAADIASESIANTGTAAEKAAKKAKKAFAAYDEINVLSKGASDSSSSGGGGGLGTASATKAVSSLAGNVANELGAVFDPLVQAWESKGKALVDSIKNAQQGIKELFGEIKLSFAEVWTNGTGQKTLELILSILTNIFNIVGNISTAFANAWKDKGGTAVIQGFANTINNLLTIVDNVGKSISEWWQSERGQSFANTVVETFAKISGAADRISAALLEIWDNGGEDVFNTLQDIFGDIGEIIGIIIGYIADLYADLVEWFAPDAEVGLQGVNSAFTVIKDVLDWLKTDGKPILEGVAYTIGLVSAAWVAYKTVMTTINIVSKAFAAVQAVVNAVMTANPIGLVVAAIAALIAIIIVCVKHWDEIKEAASKAWDGIKATWEKVSTWFHDNITEPIKNFFSKLWTDITSIFSKIGTWFKDKFTEAATGIKNVFNGIPNFFSNIWTKIKEKFTSIGTKIGDAMGGAFKKAVNAVMRTIENVVNTPIKAINSLIGVINKVPGINLGTLNTFSLPHLANGGWVAANSPRLAVIGDNRHEGEIVTPESKIREQVELALAKAKQTASNVIQTVKLQLEILVRYPDGREVIKQINEAQIQEGRILLDI
ncbi:MAG: hypothetical protein MJ168_05405 [Clostridia bacterium]|nr:hypothetical protein [Clostridia bacterium]